MTETEREKALKKLPGLLARVERPGTEDEGRTAAAIYCGIILKYGFKVVEEDWHRGPVDSYYEARPKERTPPDAEWEPTPEPSQRWDPAPATDEGKPVYGRTNKNGWFEYYGWVEVLGATSKALQCVDTWGRKFWMPFSQINSNGVITAMSRSGGTGTLECTVWIAEQKGWL